VRPGDYNVAVENLEAAISPRTRAVILSHVLGTPFAIRQVLSFCNKHDLFLIEDNCDAIGALYGVGTGDPKPTGTFGHLATLSFYPAHHMTTGEGGAVLCGSEFEPIVTSLRDWGRDCICPPGKSGCCGKRFDQHFGSLPHGYDHKYVYQRLGFNLKMTDLQASIGVAQLDRLSGFVAARRRNWEEISVGLLDLAHRIELPIVPRFTSPSPFGFLVSSSNRARLVAGLEAAKIQTRPLFAGNLLRHPAMAGVNFRVATPLPVTDKAMREAFWFGCHPGIGPREIDRIVETFHSLF